MAHTAKGIPMGVPWKRHKHSWGGVPSDPVGNQWDCPESPMGLLHVSHVSTAITSESRVGLMGALQCVGGPVR